MASIGKKNPFKPAVDKRALREQKIAKLLAEQKALKAQQTAAAPPQRPHKNGQSSGAAPAAASPVSLSATQPLAASARFDERVASPAASAASARRPASPIGAGTINHDRKRCKGHLFTIPATIVAGEGHPPGLLQSLTRDDFVPLKGKPAQATMSTSKLWKYHPANSGAAGVAAPAAAGGVGHRRTEPNRNNNTTVAAPGTEQKSSHSHLFGGEETKTEKPAPLPQYHMDAQSTHKASFVKWNTRPSTAVVPVTDHVNLRAPLLTDSTHREDFHAFPNLLANRATYDPQHVHKYVIGVGLGARHNETRNFVSESAANFDPKGINTRPMSLPQRSMPPPPAPFIFGTTTADQFEPFDPRLSPPAKSSKQKPKLHAARSETRNFETDYTHHFIQPTGMPDGAGLAKTKWK